MKNLDQMNDPNLTFKGFRKKRNSALAGIANNYANKNGGNIANLNGKDAKKDGKGNESEWSFTPKKAAEDDERSVSSKSYHTVRSGVKQVGKVSITDLLSELRHKYLTILKSHYWEFLEDGQCTPASYLLLNESADQCMDDESKEMNDWEYCKAYLYSNKSMQRIGRISQVPCLGRLFKHMFFNQLSLAYDVSISFIAAHDRADKLLQTVIQSKSFVKQILLES